MKHLIVKLSKRVGKDKVEELLPESQRKLVRATLKQERQKLNKKHQQRDERKQNLQRQKKAAKSREDEDLREGTEPAAEANDLEIECDENNVLLQYDAEKEEFHFVNRRQLKKQKPAAVEGAKQAPPLAAKEDILYLNGKIIVREQDELVGKKRKRENKFEEVAEVVPQS